MRCAPIFLLFLVGCEQIDPRPACPWELTIDALEPSATLEQRTSAACIATDDAPDQLMVEAARVDDQPVTTVRPETACSEDDLYIASLLGGLRSDDVQVPLFTPTAEHLEVIEENPEFIADGGLYRVSFLQTLDDGSWFADASWVGWFQLGVEDSMFQSTGCR